MITHDNLYGKEMHPVNIPLDQYEAIQKIAYKYNVSTRIIATALMDVAGNHPNEAIKTMGEYADKVHHPEDYIRINNKNK